MRDPFEILGVSKNATDEQIKKSYKDLAKKLHPDKNPDDPHSGEKFKEIQDAYGKIKNAKLRKEFEQEEFARQYARQGFQNTGSPFGEGQSFHFSNSDIDEDILNEIFGNFGMGGYAKKKKSPSNESAIINIDFWQAVTGAETTISLPNGSNLKVKIPEGIKEGQKIRLKGQGSKLNPRSTGDLLLEVRIKSDPNAKREGNNIYIKHNLPVDVAITGGETLIDCPLGRFQLKIAPYTNSGSKLRLKSKAPKGGDLFVEMNLVLPKERKVEIQRRFNEAS